MVVEEMGAILMILKAMYPSWAKGLSVKEAETIIKVWHDMLKEYSFEDVRTAIKMMGSTNPFPPTVSEIVSNIHVLKSEELVMTEVEAWGFVKKAIRNSTYNSKSEFEKLPKMIQDTIGNHEILKDWASVEQGAIDTVIGSNFIRSYKSSVENSKKNKMYPEEVRLKIEGKDVIKQLAEKFGGISK